MINLLPAEDKGLIKKEYLRRYSVVSGIFIFALICISIVLLSPSYFLLISQKKSLETHLAVLQEGLTREEAEKIESSSRDLNVKLTFLASQEKEKRQISGLMKQIINAKSLAIKLTGFSYEKKAKEGNHFFLEGSASTRTSFLAFIKNLAEIKDVANVISPPSNLLREEDFSFRLTLELTPQ